MERKGTRRSEDTRDGTVALSVEVDVSNGLELRKQRWTILESNRRARALELAAPSSVSGWRREKCRAAYVDFEAKMAT